MDSWYPSVASWWDEILVPNPCSILRDNFPTWWMFIPGKTAEGNTSPHSGNLLGVVGFKNKSQGGWGIPGWSEGGIILNPQEMDWGRNFHHFTFPWWGELPSWRASFWECSWNIPKPPPDPTGVPSCPSLGHFSRGASSPLSPPAKRF